MLKEERLKTEARMKFYFKLNQEEIDAMDVQSYSMTVAQLNFALEEHLKYNGWQFENK